MTPMPLPSVADIVLIGGGHTHALVLRNWGMKPLPGARLTLINPAPTAPYTGMLPGHIAGHYPRDALEIDLVRLARFAGARIVLGRATAIDRAARTIAVGDRTLAYDLASIDIGITSDLPDLKGFSEHGIPAKPLGPYATRWAAHLARTDPATLAVIGAGVGGVELAMAMAHALRRQGRPATITVLDRSAALPGTAPAAARRLRTHLASFGIELIENVDVTEVTATTVHLADGREIPSAFTVGAAGARPQDWLRDTGLDLHKGFVTVDRFLRSSDPAILACGDAAHIAHAPRPKAGVYAVRAAPVIYANLRAALSGSPRKSFDPQGDYLKLISLGTRSAVGERNGITVEGPWVWRLKDRIDRRFMDGLANLEPMAQPGLPAEVARGVRDELGGDAPLCGGCGSKVGSQSLSRALAGLPKPSRTDVLTGPGDDAAILRMGRTTQVITTDHLRAFTLDPWLMGRIAAIHSLGDIWAMGAAPQAALAQIILPPLSSSLQERTLAELLDAAGEVFATEGAGILGGHTTTGAELTLGFTVTGLSDGPPVTLAGARPGDALILTKPLGSGTILAAEMRLAAKGSDVAACLSEMARPQGSAARLLGGAHAMTDVTGFGLASHLLNILEASGTGATLDLAAIPLHEGALDLTARGIRSTIWEVNRAAAAPRLVLEETPRTALLFDPQTAGGLLAAVPGDEAKSILEALERAGYTAARIGTVTEGPVLIRAL
jgi:selenide, water dikinase